MNWSVRSRYGDFHEVRNNTNNFSLFYMDVLDLLYLTSKQYNLTINHVIALFNTYSTNHNFEVNDTPVKFRVNNVRADLSEFVNSTHVPKKMLHSQIVELILNQWLETQIILGNLIKIKNEIDKEFTYVNNVEKQVEIKIDKPKIKKTKPKVQKKKEEKVETNPKVESKTKRVSLSELNKTKTKSKKEKEKGKEEKPQVEKRREEESDFSKLVRETKEAIQTNDLLNDFL